MEIKIQGIANKLAYDSIMNRIYGLYHKNQNLRCCNGHLLTDPWLHIKWILGEDIIRTLMRGLDLHPGFNSDETTAKKLMDIPVEIDPNYPYTIRLIWEIE